MVLARSRGQDHPDVLHPHEGRGEAPRSQRLHNSAHRREVGAETIGCRRSGQAVQPRICQRIEQLHGHHVCGVRCQGRGEQGLVRQAPSGLRYVHRSLL